MKNEKLTHTSITIARLVKLIEIGTIIFRKEDKQLSNKESINETINSLFYNKIIVSEGLSNRSGRTVILNNFIAIYDIFCFVSKNEKVYFKNIDRYMTFKELQFVDINFILDKNVQISHFLPNTNLNTINDFFHTNYKKEEIDEFFISNQFI